MSGAFRGPETFGSSGESILIIPIKLIATGINNAREQVPVNKRRASDRILHKRDNLFRRNECPWNEANRDEYAGTTPGQHAASPPPPFQLRLLPRNVNMNNERRGIFF